ncbi:MAG: glycosyltransferase family 2 protein [Clostridiales bacterium]|nr:glycosyltransferase family 2 protein [Clostridiales bacterium]
MKKSVTLIVPCYNEEASLPIFYKAVCEVAALLPNYDVTMLLVNDGSKDRTLSIMRELAQKDSRVRYLSFSRNFGKEAAMYAGFCNAKGDYVAVMDADMQDPPSLLPQMLEILETQEYDSVATRRVTREGEPPIRSFFARMFYRIINKISDADIVDGARDFRLMKREMVDAIVAMCEYNRFSKGIFGWIGFRTKWLPYKNVERVAGETKWNFWGLFRYSIDGIINFSQAPLSIASLVGLFLTMISFAAIAFIVVRRILFGDPVAGWASTACIILFMGGLQLLCIGIMGQYLAKTYLEVKRRPHYIIAETNDETAKLVK